MAEEIAIKTVLDLSESGKKIQQDLSKALNAPAVQTVAKNTGRKIGESLSLGIESGAGRGSRALKNQETAVLRLAQAEARLSVASGNLRGAQTTLQTALNNATRGTVAQIGAQTQLVQIQNRAARSARDLGDSMTRLGRGLTLGVSAPLIALGIAAVKTATDFDALKRGLISVSGSSEAAERQLVRLKEVAKLPGLGLREAIQGSINLQAAGLSAERAEKALKVFGNALATVGRGKAELDGVIRALSQIESKGKVSAEEINQLAERIPQIRQIMLKAFGTADTEVIQRAKITSSKFIDAVVTELDKLPKVTGGARNTFENLRDSIEQSLLPLGNRLLETILPAIEKLSPKILGLLESFGKLSDSTKTLVVGFGAAAIAAGPLTIAIANLTRAIAFLNTVGLGAGLANLARFGLIGAGVAGVGAVGFGILADIQARENLQKERIAAGRALGTSADPRAIEAELARRRGLPGQQALAGVGLNLGGIISSIKGIAPHGGGGGGGGGTGAARQKSELEKAIQETKRLTELVKALKKDKGELFEEEFKQLQLDIERDQLMRELRNRAFRAVLTAQGKPLPPELPGGIGLRGIRVPIPGAPVVGGGPPVSLFQDTGADRLDVERKREQEFNQRLRIQEAQITNQERAGLLTAAEAQRAMNAARAASRDEMIKTLKEQRDLIGANSIEGLQLTEQIEQMQLLGVEYSNTTRFMIGFNSQIESSGDAFDRFGQNVARAFGNVRDLFNSLKQAVLGFFNDILGQALQNLVRGVLGPLFGGGGGGGGGAGGFLRQILGGGGGGGISTPSSVSGATGIFANGAFARGLAGVTGGGGSSTTSGGFGGFSFGGLGSGFAAAAPLLGLSLGSALGGQSIGGQILGAIGGGAAGIGASFGASVFGAGGGLGQAALAALGPIALIGAPLLIGAFLFGRAKRRRNDEQAAGEMLIQAQDAIRQLASGIASDSIDGSQARGIFDSQILGQFRQQIGTLKTKSVRESRLTNQVRDLRTFYGNVVEPEIAAQFVRRQNAITHGKLVPEFAAGGLTRGGLALLHPNEMVLTLQQQSAIARMVGPSIFQAAGVPGLQQNAQFDRGGIMPASQSSGDIVIEQLVIGISAEGIFVAGGQGAKGRAVIVKSVQAAQANGEL